MDFNAVSTDEREVLNRSNINNNEYNYSTLVPSKPNENNKSMQLRNIDNISDFSAPSPTNKKSRMGSEFRMSRQFPTNMTHRTNRTQNERKEPEREFFELTVLAYQLRNNEICPALM